MKVKIQCEKEVKTSRDSMGSFGEFDVIGGSRKNGRIFLNSQNLEKHKSYKSF